MVYILKKYTFSIWAGKILIYAGKENAAAKSPCKNP